jgi:hypothetical protein
MTEQKPTPLIPNGRALIIVLAVAAIPFILYMALFLATMATDDPSLSRDEATHAAKTVFLIVASSVLPLAFLIWRLKRKSSKPRPVQEETHRTGQDAV